MDHHSPSRAACALLIPCGEVLRRRYEHLDGAIHHSADRMARRFYGISRGRRVNSLAARFRDHLVDFALCFGQKNGLSVLRLR